SYDITDIQKPTLRGSYSSLNSPKSLAVTGNYLFTTEYSNTGIKIFDITDPSTILWVPSAPFNFNNSTNISIYGRTMFLSHPTSVKIIEFTTPYDITIASEIPTINNQRVVQQGRYIFIPNWQYGMTIYDISDKTKPKMISTYQTKDAISAVDVRGDYAFLAAGYEGLIILDIKDVSNPIEVSSFYNDNILPVYGVKVFNNIAYLACSKKGFAIINIKDPKNPYLIAKFEEGYSFADDISVYGNIAFIQARSEIQILNIEP
ncbi:MAG: hypothetical protein N3B13_03650, partial [Deltaproteobacteria bacterium]|nr:hypothetical protein [Deltaproteobacteria bacterium]